MSVFAFKDSDTLVALEPAEFAREDDFQELLAKFPSLLSGGQTDDAPLQRWLLIKREKSIPAEDGGGGRWSVDHLFIDQDGVPTLVEVKRQTDTRLRREVVGQMLDYAANAVVYWPIADLRAEFEARCEAEGADADEKIRSHLGADIDPGAIWERVKTNLQAGRVRMLFVADHIPPELRRIVEFLNQQMDPAEMLALELRQFVGEGLRTIVPMLYGQTEEARRKKATGTRRPVNADKRIIRLIPPYNTQNPKRPDTAAHAKFAAFKDGMTIDEYRSTPGNGGMGEIRWCLEHNFIRLEDPAETAC
jgi:hypothetical protein